MELAVYLQSYNLVSLRYIYMHIYILEIWLLELNGLRGILPKNTKLCMENEMGSIKWMLGEGQWLGGGSIGSRRNECKYSKQRNSVGCRWWRISADEGMYTWTVNLSRLETRTRNLFIAFLVSLIHPSMWFSDYYVSEIITRGIG